MCWIRPSLAHTGQHICHASKLVRIRNPLSECSKIFALLLSVLVFSFIVLGSVFCLVPTSTCRSQITLAERLYRWPRWCNKGRKRNCYRTDLGPFSGKVLSRNWTNPQKRQSQPDIRSTHLPVTIRMGWHWANLLDVRHLLWPFNNELNMVDHEVGMRFSFSKT
jgi:hypothetical protein